MSTGGIPLPRLNPRRSFAPPPPPAGFVLEEDAGGIPPPPPGFVLEAKPASAAVPPPPPPPPPGFVLEEPTGDSLPLQGSLSGTVVGEGAKGLVRGAGNVLSTAIKGAPGIYATGREALHRSNVSALDILDRIERGEQPPVGPTPTIPRVSAPDRGDIPGSRLEERIETMGPEDAMAPDERWGKFLAMTPEQRAAERERLAGVVKTYQPTNVEDTLVYKAGEGLGGLVSDTFPVASGWEDSVTTMLSEGLGSVAGGIGLYGVGGPFAAGGLFTLSGAGEAADRAIEWDKAEKAAGRPGATPQDIATASIFGTVAGATDLVPIEAALGVLRVPTPFRRPVAKAIARIGGQALIEGGQEGLQQVIQNTIAQTVYDPEQEIGEGVAPNVGAGAGVGGIVQTIIEAVTPGRSRGAPRTQQEAQPQAQPAAPPVAAPQAPPVQTAPPQPAAPVAPPAPTAAPATVAPEDVEDEPVRDIAELPPDEVDVLRGAGWSDDAILDMADEERVAAAEEAIAQGVERAPAPRPEPPAPAAASPAITADKTADISPERNVADAPQAIETAAVSAEQARTSAETKTPTVAPPPERASGIEMVDPRSLKVAPARFQFRENTDTEGLVPTLKGVQKWRPERGNQIIVWEDKAGQRFVVDGHQRTGLAKRLMAEGKETDIQIPAVVFREADGITAEEATTLASLKNIAEGSASPIEAAKVLRSAGPDRLADLPMPKDAVRSAVDLSKLDDEAFRMVVNGVVEPNHAKYVGRFLAEDAARQIAAMKALSRAEPANEDEAAVLVRRVAAAELAKGEAGAQVDMFGESPDSTALEEVRIVAGAMRQLRRDKALFAKVAAEADRIEKTGSRIERKAAEQTAEDADRLSSGLDTIAFRAGPIRDKLKSLASEVKNESRPLSEARNLFVDALRSGDEVAGETRGRTGGPEREDQAGGEQRQPGRARKGPDKLASAKVEPAGKHYALDPSGPITVRRELEFQMNNIPTNPADAARMTVETEERIDELTALGDSAGYDTKIMPAHPERRRALRVKEPTTEPGAEGLPQTVLPGAERISEAEVARRKADAALAARQAQEKIAPKKPQKAADEGLFGDERKQLTLFRRDGSPMPVVEQRALANDLRSIIGRVAGRRVEVRFAGRIDMLDVLPTEQIEELDRAARSSGGQLVQTVGGSWTRGTLSADALIKVALADPKYDPETTAFHESWHQVEMSLLSDAELRVLEAELPRLRAFAAAEIGRSPNDPYIRNQPDYEIAAIAFQRYARMKKAREDIGGIGIAVRRMFDKIMEVLRQVRRTLRGRKIERYEDLFGRAYRGDYARRGEGVEAVERALFGGGGVEAMIGNTEIGDQTFASIKVYHGSPHDFDRFSMDKIGTGEGAQAYGHGLYFAENRETAQAYREVLPAQKAGSSNTARNLAGTYLRENNWDGEAAARALEAQVRKMGVVGRFKSPEIASDLREAAALARGGRMYEVSVDAEPDEFLDWDKPLSEQPDAVRTYVEQKFPRFAQQTKHGNEMQGEELGRLLARSPEDMQALRAAGIKGIRYMDAGSRSKDSGTYNYVVFDDSLLTITGKDGKPVKPDTLASSSVTRQTETEAFKRWFGKSKVVNEDGSPMVVYHGTPSEFREDFAFRDDLIGSVTDSGHFGRGFYFANSKGEARYYGKNVGAFYLSLQNPLDLSNETGDLTYPGHFLSWAPKLEAIGALSNDLVTALASRRAANKYVEDNVSFNGWSDSHLGTEGVMASVPNPAKGYEEDRIGLRNSRFMPQTNEEALEQLKHEFASEMERFHDGQFPNLSMSSTSLSDYVRVGDGGGPSALTAKAKAAGYDGLIYGDEYIAFSPTQIKSVANRGTFDPSNPSILASSIPIAGPMPGTFIADRTARLKERMRGIADPIRVRVQDRYLAIKRFQEKVEAETGITLDTPINVYQAIRIYTGRGGEKLVDLQSEHVEPLIEDMRARKVSGPELDDYLYARHAPERNREMARINPDIGDAGSGMSDAEAAAIMDGFADRMADFEALAVRVDAITSFTRKELVTAGLIDPKTALAWKTKYPNYVPLRGFDDPAASVDQAGIGLSGKGFDVRGPESKAALGRRSKADSPVAYVVQQAEMAIVRAEKNRTLKTVLRFAQDPSVAPSGAFKIDKGEMARRISPQTGLVETYAKPPQFSKAENLFGVKIGGKTHWITVEDPSFARALRGVGSGVDNALARGLLTVSHTYAKLLTQWNPEFVPTNAVRDLQTALVNVSEFDSLAKGTRTKILKDAFTLKAVRGAMAAMYDRKTTNEMASYYNEFRRAGGKVSYIELNEIDAIKKRIDRSVKAGDMRRALGNVADLVGNLNTAVENGVRLSVYANLRKAGIEQDRAAFIARDLTTDFNLRGEWGPTINAMYIFFNASIQGSFRLARAVVKSKTARFAVAGIFATGFAMEFLNALIGGGDDDDNPYDKIEDYEFERNMIVMLPGGDYVKLPLAYGYNVFYVAGQQLARTLRGKQEAGTAAAMVGTVSLDSFNPIGAVASLGQLVSPWFIDPVIQSAENKTFFGSPIMPTQYDEKKPLSETYWKSAPSWAKGLARELNAFGVPWLGIEGGNVGRPGTLDVSPETLQHYVEFAGGGVGRFVANTVAAGERLIAGDEWLPEKMPFARRFYGKTDTGAATQRQFFDAWTDIDQAHFEQLRLKEARDIDGAAKARETYRAEIAAHGAFNSAMKARKKLREARDAAERIEDSEARKARLELLDEREQAVMQRALDVYRKAKGD